MNRRSFVKNSSLGFGAIPLFGGDWLTKFMQDNPYKMKMLRNDVGIFTEKGGTIGYYISKREGLPYELPDNFPSNLLLDALEDYKQEILPLDTKDQMHTAIMTLIQHNAFQMKFEWLIIFTIADEIDPNYTFIDRLRIIKYSDYLLTKFIKGIEIVRPYFEGIEFETYIKIAKVNFKCKSKIFIIDI